MIRTGSDSLQTSYLYTGQQFDPTTELYQLRSRTYDPMSGRFLSRDSYYGELANPYELNRYVYTANNPINAFDPTGMFAEYTASQQNNEDQAEDHARYVNGVDFAKGQDKAALHQQAIFAALIDSIDMMMLKAFRNTLFDTSAYHPEKLHHFTMGLGTVLGLRSGRLQTGVSLIRYRWDDLGGLLNSPQRC